MNQIFGEGPLGQRIARWIAWGLMCYLLGLLIGYALSQAGYRLF